MRPAVGTLAAVLSCSLTSPAGAEVPAPPDGGAGREFRVDFSAKHLEVGAELRELSLSGDVVVTVGRYRLRGDSVHLQRGPRGIDVSGGGEIAFCSCDDPPITLGYREVTIAPPSDVLVEHAVLRTGGVPVFWLPYLWLRSPDRVALVIPSVEWRGDEGLLLGSGLHLPFSANQGRPAARSLDLAAYAYLQGGARIEAQLLTPRSTQLVSWDYLGQSALRVEAHAASFGETAAVWAYDVDASRGARGRSSLTSLDAAARRYDHARVGVGSVGPSLLALGVAADAARGDALDAPVDVGPFGVAATGGSLGRAASYELELGTGSWFATRGPRTQRSETRALEQGSLQGAALVGPVLGRAAAYQRAETVSLPAQAASRLELGTALGATLPLLRRFGGFRHELSPELLGRIARHFADGGGANRGLVTAGLRSRFGRPARGAAASFWAAGGLAGDPEQLEPVGESELSADARWAGLTISARGEPRRRSAEGIVRGRLGAREGTAMLAYVEARTDRALGPALLLSGGELLPSFAQLGALEQGGVTAGGEVTLGLWSVLQVGGGADLDASSQELLALRAFGRYRHHCGCVALAAYGSTRVGRGGVDVGLGIDLMP